jgi:hypothetical protein
MNAVYPPCAWLTFGYGCTNIKGNATGLDARALNIGLSTGRHDYSEPSAVALRITSPRNLLILSRCFLYWWMVHH